MENLNVNALRTLAGVLPLFGQQAEGQKGSVVGVADNVRNTSQPVKRSKTDSSQADTKVRIPAARLPRQALRRPVSLTRSRPASPPVRPQENARGGRSALGDITNASTSNAADKVRAAAFAPPRASAGLRRRGDRVCFPPCILVSPFRTRVSCPPPSPHSR